MMMIMMIDNDDDEDIDDDDENDDDYCYRYGVSRVLERTSIMGYLIINAQI